MKNEFFATFIFCPYPALANQWIFLSIWIHYRPLLIFLFLFLFLCPWIDLKTNTEAPARRTQFLSSTLN